MRHASKLGWRERVFAEDTKTAARARAYPERVLPERMHQARYWVCQESVHEESHGIGPTPIMCRTPLASVKATDTELFRAYVRRVLCPTLRAGDVVIMDNLSPHKSAETLGLIQQLGANVLFLPAYSPDLNPIEKMWSKLKEFLRSAQARSQPALIQAIASALAAITPQDAMNWFASCGYSFI